MVGLFSRKQNPCNLDSSTYWSSHGVTRFFLKRMIMLNPLLRIQKKALLNPRTIFLHTSFGRRLLLVVFLVVKFLLDLKRSRKKSHKIGHFNKKVRKTHIRPWKQCNLYSLESRQWWFLLIRRSEQKVKHSVFFFTDGMCFGIVHRRNAQNNWDQWATTSSKILILSMVSSPKKPCRKNGNFLGANVFRLGLLKVEGERVGTSQLGCKDAEPDPRFTVCPSKLQFGVSCATLKELFGDSFVIL